MIFLLTPWGPSRSYTSRRAAGVPEAQVLWIVMDKRSDAAWDTIPQAAQG